MKNILLKSRLLFTVSLLTALCVVQLHKPAKTHVHHQHALIASIAVAPGQVASGDQYGQSLHPKGVGTPAQALPTQTAYAAPAANPHAYSYMFTGVATANGQPLVNARLEIRVTSDASADIHYTTTDSTGRFYLPVSVDGQPSQTLSWEIRGVTGDLKRVALEGHQILTDDHVVHLTLPAQFAEI